MNEIKAEAFKLEAAKPIAIVISEFNQPVTDLLLKEALARFEVLNYPSDLITVVHVPGAGEIPITAQRLAKTKRFAAIITLGAVIRGETAHFEYVCEKVNDGCQQVSLAFDMPVIFGVLTTENGEQAFARCNGEHANIGQESVDCALTMISVLEQVTHKQG